ncbi:MAG: DNA repair protein RadA [Clostridia bacterium]|nr:DNA repair protein RadA [Clostridia bacterium]
MAKVKTTYVCASCGYATPKWMGRCPECGSWNSFNEETPAAEEPAVKLKRQPGSGAQALTIDEIPEEGACRLSSGIGELDRVLGGGVVEGSMVLVGGDPGIGKSTLLTQLSANLSRSGEKVLYVSGEESARQIKLRAARLKAGGSGFYVLSENDMGLIEARINQVQPRVCVIDSIQTMYLTELSSAPGSVTQVRECASRLMMNAKASGTAVFLVGHVTKEGNIAGPRVLEHMVDAVLYFEGERSGRYRILRAVKNRFGSVNELGMFEMTGEGMREVPNASELLLSERAQEEAGCAVMCALEGSRPLLTDVQALVTPTVFGNPRRMTQGVDLSRLCLLLAVMEKRAALNLYNQDVYINIAGGLSLSEPAADLAVCAAVASGFRNITLDKEWAVMGEVGLAGELRGITQAERRLAECARLGFKHALLPKVNLRGLTVPEGITPHGADTLFEAFRTLGLYRKTQ